MLTKVERKILNDIWGHSHTDAENRMRASIKEQYPNYNIDFIETIHHDEFDTMAYEARAVIIYDNLSKKEQKWDLKS